MVLGATTTRMRNVHSSLGQFLRGDEFAGSKSWAHKVPPPPPASLAYRSRSASAHHAFYQTSAKLRLCG